jgi:hypothetical protein
VLEGKSNLVDALHDIKAWLANGTMMIGDIDRSALSILF